MTTGSDGLDDLLGGGLPDGRTVLVTGGPGTGKSTLAMGFLQAGLDAGERCLLVSTEQTAAELRDSFAGFDFDLDHERLDLVTLQAVPGDPVTHDESMLVFEPDDDPDDHPLDFTDGSSLSYLRGELEPYAPVDRVVVDSVSALSGFAVDRDRFRRDVLELVRFVANRFDATSLFTSERGTVRAAHSEGGGPLDALKYITHGVVDLQRVDVEGSARRRLRVEKLRGREHDSRPHEYELTPEGVRVLGRRPVRRTTDETAVPTRVDGLDELLGGGVVRGGTGLLEHDGRANLTELVARVVEAAIEEGFVVPFVPSVNMTPEGLERYLSPAVGTVDELLATDRLFVFDAAGVRDADERNVFHVADGPEDVQRAAERIDERRGDDPLYYVANTEAFLHAVTPDELRELRYWARLAYLTPEDTALFMHYPEMIDDELAEFFVDDANQVLRTWLDDSGLQYVKLEKSPTGHVGSSGYVEFEAEYPYVDVRLPR